MTVGLDRTIETLAASENFAALDLLVELFLHCEAKRKDAILELLLSRHHRDVLYRLVQNFERLSEGQAARLLAEGGRLSAVLRRAYVDADENTYQNACTLIRRLPDYDQSTLLLSSILAKDEKRKQEAAVLMRELTASLLRESNASPAERTQHDIEAVRKRFLETLRQGMRKYPLHHAEVVVESFLLMAEDGAPEVARILREGNDPCHRPMVGVLKRSSDPRVTRWMMQSLNTRHPPRAVQLLISDRDDAPFVEQLLDNVSLLAEPLAAANLRQIDEIKWLEPDHPLLARLSEQRQSAAVIFAVHSGIPIEKKVEVVALILDEGKPVARRAAACALAQIPGNDANQLIAACLEDPDPEIQLAVTQFLRNRGIPNAMAMLIGQLNHPDERIRSAAQKALSDFNFDRYVGTFDQMDEASRRSAGSLILRIDPKAKATLRQELMTPQRQHRMRAARIIRTLGLVDEFQDDLIDALTDADKMVRREAIETLMHSRTPAAVERLASAAQSGDQRQAGAVEAIALLRRDARDDKFRQAAQIVAERLGIA